MEDAIGFRNHLLCLGIHLSRHSCWCPRSSAVSFGGDAVPGCGSGPLRLDDRAGRAPAKLARMGLGIHTCCADLRARLRPAVLGRAACAFRHCRGHDGHHPGVHGIVGNRLTANAAAHPPPGPRAPGRDGRSGGADEPFAAPRRDAHRQRGRGGADRCIDELVDLFGAHAQAAVAVFQSHELGSADARRRDIPDTRGGSPGRVS